MFVYIEDAVSDILDIELQILTSETVYFVFRDKHVLQANENLLRWLENSPLKRNFQTLVMSA